MRCRPPEKRQGRLKVALSDTCESLIEERKHGQERHDLATDNTTWTKPLRGSAEGHSALCQDDCAATGSPIA
jgi:hypothetical protein